MPFRGTPENIQTRQLNKIPLSLDFAYEPINFVVNGTVVSEKIILKKTLMCSFSKHNQNFYVKGA